MISSFAFGQESTASQMLLYGKYLLNTGKVFDAEKKLAAVDNLDKNAVNELLAELYFSSYSVAVVGKNATKVEV